MRTPNLENEEISIKKKKKSHSINVRLDEGSVEIIEQLLELSSNNEREIKISDIIRACLLNTKGIPKDKLVKLLNQVIR